MLIQDLPPHPVTHLKVSRRDLSVEAGLPVKLTKRVQVTNFKPSQRFTSTWTRIKIPTSPQRKSIHSSNYLNTRNSRLTLMAPSLTSAMQGNFLEALKGASRELNQQSKLNQKATSTSLATALQPILMLKIPVKNGVALLPQSSQKKSKST